MAEHELPTVSLTFSSFLLQFSFLFDYSCPCPQLTCLSLNGDPQSLSPCKHSFLAWVRAGLQKARARGFGALARPFCDHSWFSQSVVPSVLCLLPLPRCLFREEHLYSPLHETHGKQRLQLLLGTRGKS